MRKRYSEQIAPFNYFPNDPDKVVTRVTFYDDDKEVGFIDILLTDDTAYYLYLEVKPEYRKGKFMAFMTPDKEETKRKFIRPRTVWLNVNPAVAKKSAQYLEYRRTLTEADKLIHSKMYISGVMKAVEET